MVSRLSYCHTVGGLDVWSESDIIWHLGQLLDTLRKGIFPGLQQLTLILRYEDGSLKDSDEMVGVNQICQELGVLLQLEFVK